MNAEQGRSQPTPAPLPQSRVAGELAAHPEASSTASGDLYFSPSLNLHVSIKPLAVDDRVVEAAGRAGIKLDWDDQCRIVNISFADARRLLDALGSTMLSPKQYWELYHEAAAAGDAKLLAALASDSATEWLDAVFVRDGDGKLAMIEHPEIAFDGVKATFSGQAVDPRQPEGKPGWFRPLHNIDPATGMPKQVSLHRDPGQTGESGAQWKYWASPQSNEPVSAIRGYVTSSGTPSFDLGIPASAVAPVLTIRECRAQPLEPALDADLIAAADRLSTLYGTTLALAPGQKDSEPHQAFYDHRQLVFEAIEQHADGLRANGGAKLREVREKLADILGTLRLEAEAREDSEAISTLLASTRRIFGDAPALAGDKEFRDFAASSRADLAAALMGDKPVVFVMGHPNPDTDTAISALIEAWRSSLVDPDTLYVPVMQTKRIPDEIAELLGPGLAADYVLSAEPGYQQLAQSGRPRWILVDQNVSDVQRFAIGIVDHHTLSENAERQDVPKTWEMMGSCSAQVAQKLYGIGGNPGGEVSRLLYGATLMDTENRLDAKMTYRDALIMDRLRGSAGVTDDGQLYHALMSSLLGTADAEQLFGRDYKQDWGTFGFAVAKVQGCFGHDGECLRPELISELQAWADANNRSKNFPLTLVKLVNYENGNERVERERMYLVFNDHASPELQEAMRGAIETLAKHYLGEQTATNRGEGYIEYLGSGKQLSRKVVAPAFEQIVKLYNGHFYSESTGLYVSREFLKDSPAIRSAAAELSIALSAKPDGTINYISYEDSKRLLDKLGLQMLSLEEYWKVYREARTLRDEQMQAHLRSADHVEYLDTLILDRKSLLHHPVIDEQAGVVSVSGDRIEAAVPEGLPGLIKPDEIDPATGLPGIVHQPNQYGDRSLWRYWSPDADLVVPTRGHIFLYGQPALDLKVHPGERFANLGIRAAAKSLELPAVVLERQDGEWKLSTSPEK